MTTVYRRAGWVLPGILDTYLRYDSAGDHFVGRTVCGLPLDRAEFAILPPFINISREADEAFVAAAIHSCFPHFPSALVLVARFESPLWSTTLISSVPTYHQHTLYFNHHSSTPLV